jgi:hypothetical protein
MVMALLASFMALSDGWHGRSIGQIGLEGGKRCGPIAAVATSERSGLPA